MRIFEKSVLNEILGSIQKFPDRSAFYINNKYFSYKTFSENISKIQNEIRRCSFTGKNVGLIVNDDIETYASIIAIWLEGLAYIPIHPGYPVDRALEIVNQACVDLFIDSSKNRFIESKNLIETRKISFSETELIPNEVDDEEIAYILFTSGSTGKPKGVPVTRGNVGAFMNAFWDIGFMIDENDRCLQCFDLTFDVSVQSFLVPLSRGACIYTIPHDQIKPSYAFGLLEEEKLTFGAMAPSMIRFLRPYFDEIDLPDLRYNILTAEASPLGLVDEWSSCVPNAEIFDFYGPTEATIYCTYYKYRRNISNKQLNGMISIGRPMKNIIAIITDDDRNILPANAKGELCIAGDQITKGYWNNPEKNATSFFEKKINNKLHRFYKTGDLCYFDEEGDIMYSGRLDFQIKIQGFRVELGEIEHQAREYLKGRNIVAVAIENGSGSIGIALFIEGNDDNTNSLSDYLKSKLPHYMIPARIIEKDVFPLNANGKVDRNMLKNSIVA